MKIIDKRNKLRKHPTKRYARRSRNQIKYIAIHHSASISGSAEAFADYHVNNLGWPGIGYHYVIAKDGTISHCHDVEVISYHVGNSNRDAIGICMIGDFTKEKPTPAQYQAALKLTKMLMSELNISSRNVLGHREFPNNSTSCPVIDMNQFRNDLKEDNQKMQEIKRLENKITQLEKLLAAQNENEPSDWAKKDWEEAKANGYFDGTRPLAPITRQEAAIVVNRLRNNFLKLIGGNREMIEKLEKRLAEIERK